MVITEQQVTLIYLLYQSCITFNMNLFSFLGYGSQATNKKNKTLEKIPAEI